MNRVICNRCENECSGSTYYTIDIYGHDINPTNDGRVSASTAAQNLNTSMKNIFTQPRHYCKKCEEKIEAMLWSDLFDD